eukprot:gene19465-22130_t
MEDLSSNGRWRDLHVPKDELSLDLTLNMGQCFNWKKIEHTSDMCWVGILGAEPLVVKQTLGTTEFISLRQPTNGPDYNLNQAMRQYFQLDHNLNDLYEEWGQGCERMKVVTQCLKGARVWTPPGLSMEDDTQERYKWIVNYDAPRSTSSESSLAYDLYEFPSVTALAEASEDELRALGMGYRAKYIINSAKLVRSKCAELSTHIVDGVKKEKSEASTTDLDNGALWFEHLRHLAAEARRHCTSTVNTENTDTSPIKIKQEPEALLKIEPGCTPVPASTTLQEDLVLNQQIDAARLQVQALLLELPGVGRKVADCVALFSLDQTSAVPVDTHVWNIAIRDYAPQLRRAAVKGEPITAMVEQVVKSELTETSVSTDIDNSAINTPAKKMANSKRSRANATTLESAHASPQSTTPIYPLHTPHDQATFHSTQITPAEVDSIETRSLTPAVYEAVGAEFRRRFGKYAGWAHSVLFAAELGAFKDRLPVVMQTEMKVFADLQRSAKK